MSSGRSYLGLGPNRPGKQSLSTPSYDPNLGGGSNKDPVSTHSLTQKGRGFWCKRTRHVVVERKRERERGGERKR